MTTEIESVCESCQGKGFSMELVEGETGLFEKVLCPDCGGTGMVSMITWACDNDDPEEWVVA